MKPHVLGPIMATANWLKCTNGWGRLKLAWCRVWTVGPCCRGGIGVQRADAGGIGGGRMWVVKCCLCNMIEGYRRG